MVLALVQQRRIGQVHHLAIHARAEALLVQMVKQILELALAAAHYRRHHRYALTAALFQNALHNLVGGLPRNGPAAIGAVRRAHAGIEQTQVVVNLGDGAHRRSRTAAGSLLLDGNRRAQPLDRIHVGALDLIQKLPRVGRERLHVAALALGIDGIEGERAFARAGEARDHGERVARNAHADVAQIVLTRAAHGNVSDRHD